VNSVFSTPRPIPGRLMPALAGTAVILLALPVFAIAGWPLRGWTLAAVLWVAAETLQLLLARVNTDPANVAAQAVVGIGTIFRAVAVGVPLVAVSAADERVALAAALLYALAFTLEFALSLARYLLSEPTKRVA